MPKRCFIITGSSRGIGEALASLLLKEGALVFGISRESSKLLNQHNNYSHIHLDLGDTHLIESLIMDIIKRISTESLHMLCLINNAAIVEPLKPIEDCTNEEISKSLQINLIAPIVMTSCFSKHTAEMKVRRKIVNISSGSAIYPAPDMSIYAAAKAGMNIFTRCVGLEQANSEYPLEIIAVDPGMVDTEMQRTARGKSSDDFAMQHFFQEAFENKHLQSAAELAEHLINIIDKPFEPGQLINYLEG